MSKLNTIAALVNDNVTTVVLSMYNDKSEMKYTFKVARELAQTLKAGDLMLAETVRGLAVGYVIEVHEVSDINPDASYDYQWAFQKIDIDGLKALKDAEEAVVKKLDAQRREGLRKKVLDSLVADGFDPKLLEAK